jgi:hypothetical protein
VEEAKLYADMGVHRLTIATRARDIPGMRDELFRFASHSPGRGESGVMARTAKAMRLGKRGDRG